MRPQRKMVAWAASAAIAAFPFASCDGEAPARGGSVGGDATPVSGNPDDAGADRECGKAPLDSAQSETSTPPLGVFWSPFKSVSPPDRFPQRPNGEVVAEFDPQTLAISQRARILLKDRITAAWAYSPDQRYLALGDVASSGVRIVDLERWEISSEFDLPGDGSVKHLAWARPDQLLATTETKDTHELIAANPRSGRVLAREEIPRSLRPIAIDPFRDRIVLLLAPADALGAARLAVYNGNGPFVSSALKRIRAGSRPAVEEGTGRVEQPALAVDPAEGRAFVLPADGPVAEIDVTTDALPVTYHDLADPGRDSAGLSNHSRTATWLGCETIALTGTDSRPVGPPRQHPAGLQLIDVRDWTASSIDTKTEHVTASDGFLLASRVEPPDSFRSAGLAILSSDGGELGRIPGSQEPRLVGTNTGFAYVSIGNRPKTKVGIFELPSAAKIGTTRPSSQAIQFPNGSARLSEAARTRGYYP